jgi:hypothetical protein
MEKKIKIQKLNEAELLKFLPLSQSATHKFTYNPKVDGKEVLPKEYRPTFELKQMDIRAKKEFNMHKVKIQRDATLILSNPEREDAIKSGSDENEKLLKLVKDYVVGWTNFKTAQGELIDFETGSNGTITFESFMQIPAIIQANIIQELVLISGLTSQEELGLKY